jgi:hypothetical protein
MFYDKKALALGIKHEMEHTKDHALATKIAVDHLLEDPKYYDKLVAAGLEETDEGALTPLEAGMAECGETPQVVIISPDNIAAASQVRLSSSDLGKGGKPKPLTPTGLTAPEPKVINNKNTVAATKTPSMIATPSSSDAIDHFCGQINNGIAAQEV